MTTGFEEQLMRAIGRIWKSNWGWIVLALLGEGKVAETILQELTEVSKKTYVSDVFLGHLLYALGKHDSAFESFERAFERRSTDFSQFETYAWQDFQELHRDHRWVDLKKRIGLP